MPNAARPVAGPMKPNGAAFVFSALSMVTRLVKASVTQMARKGCAGVAADSALSPVASTVRTV